MQMKHRLRTLFSGLCFCTLLCPADAHATKPEINYDCTFQLELDPNQLICQDATGTLTLAVGIRTVHVHRKRQFVMATTYQYPQSRCCGTLGCTVSDAQTVKLDESARNATTFTFDGRRAILLIGPPADSIDAVYFSSRSQLGYSACSSCPAPLLGTCERVP